MKKIILTVALSTTVVSATDSIIGEFGSSNTKVMSGISLDVGMWNIDWEQTSTSSDMIQDKNNLIDVDYSIESSLALIASLKFNYRYVSGTIKYSDNSLSAGEGGDINSLNVGLALLDLIPYIDVELRYVKSNFDGKMSALKNDGTDVSSGDFKTKLDIFDLIIYPFNDYLGLGYRTYNYEFPQDAYITHDSSGDVLNSGLIDFAYEGYFYTLALDNKKMVDARNNYNGLVYSLTLGLGELSPKALKNELVDAETAKLINSYLGESEALFYDIEFGYSYKTKKSNNNIGYGVTAGYRYNKIDVDESSTVNNDGYSIQTKFNTEFYGPFIDLSVRY